LQARSVCDELDSREEEGGLSPGASEEELAGQGGATERHSQGLQRALLDAQQHEGHHGEDQQRAQKRDGPSAARVGLFSQSSGGEGLASVQRGALSQVHTTLSIHGPRIASVNC